jgi:hypothetical protein
MGRVTVAAAVAAMVAADPMEVAETETSTVKASVARETATEGTTVARAETQAVRYRRDPSAARPAGHLEG